MTEPIDLDQLEAALKRYDMPGQRNGGMWIPITLAAKAYLAEKRQTGDNAAALKAVKSALSCEVAYWLPESVWNTIIAALHAQPADNAVAQAQRFNEEYKRKAQPADKMREGNMKGGSMARKTNGPSQKPSGPPPPGSSTRNNSLDKMKDYEQIAKDEPLQDFPFFSRRMILGGPNGNELIPEKYFKMKEALQNISNIKDSESLTECGFKFDECQKIAREALSESESA